MTLLVFANWNTRAARLALARRLTLLIRTRTRLFITDAEAGLPAFLSTAIRC